MAVDETLLEGCARNGAPTVLRCYSWAPVTLSIGAHQQVELAVDREWLRARGVGLVRRPTGGRAVLHARELTYSLSAPVTPETGGVTQVYRLLSEGLREGLHRLGIDAELERGRPGAAAEPGSERDRGSGGEGGPTAPCFTSPARWELLWKGRKLVGSAQRRVQGGFLQHGSIPLEADEESVKSATGNRAMPGGWMVGLEEAAGRPLELEEVSRALAAGFATLFGGPAEEDGLTTAETDRAQELMRTKYETEDWNLSGVDPNRVPGGRSR